jgi:hypothetical protein
MTTPTLAEQVAALRSLADQWEANRFLTRGAVMRDLRQAADVLEASASPELEPGDGFRGNHAIFVMDPLADGRRASASPEAQPDPIPPYNDDRGDLQEAWVRGYHAASQPPAIDPERLARALWHLRAGTAKPPRPDSANWAEQREHAARLAAEYEKLSR